MLQHFNKADRIGINSPRVASRYARRFGASVLLGGGMVGGLLGGALTPATAATVTITPSCGDVIGDATTPAGTSFKLGASVTGCTEWGLIIGADNVTLDLNGHTVSGTAEVLDGTTALECDVTSGPGDEAGILVGGFRDPTGEVVKAPKVGVKITGSAAGGTRGQVKYFDAGIAVEGGSLHIIERVIVSDNIGSRKLASDYGDGILINNASVVDVLDNEVSGNGPYSGISTIGTASQTVVIKGNTVSNNNIQTHNYIANPNVCYDQDRGIGVEQNTVANIVAENTVTGNGLDGIDIFPNSLRNVVRDNVVKNNGRHSLSGLRQGDGIRLFGGTYRGVGGTRDNPTASLSADTTEGQSSIFGNTACDNGGHGIAVFSNDNRIYENTARSNGGAAQATVGNCGTSTTGDAYFDLYDDTLNVTVNANGGSLVNQQPVPCGTNVWSDNIYGDRNQSCID